MNSNLISCPYNKSHLLSAQKIQSHLLKCRKQNPELAKSIQICPYNETHHVSSKDMGSHFIKCTEYSVEKGYTTIAASVARDTNTKLAIVAKPDQDIKSQKKGLNSRLNLHKNDDAEEWM